MSDGLWMVSDTECGLDSAELLRSADILASRGSYRRCRSHVLGRGYR